MMLTFVECGSTVNKTIRFHRFLTRWLFPNTNDRQTSTTMENIVIKDETGRAIAVLFLENKVKERSLLDIHFEMMEQICEFLPTPNFHFVSVWGVPVSAVQEEKSTLVDALDDEGCLVIRPSNVPVNLPNENPSKETKTLKQDDKRAEEPEVSELAESFGKPDVSDAVTLVKPEIKPAKKAKLQSTLTTYFGVSSKPKLMCPTASARKVHVFSEREIEQATGIEKQRKLFWNEKAEELCKNECYDDWKAGKINQLLHEKWKLRKACLVENEHEEISNKIDDILSGDPDLVSKISISRKVKSKTVQKNLERIEKAKKALEKSRLNLPEMNGNKDKCGHEKMQRKQEAHRKHYKELHKAEDALRQNLGCKKKILSKLRTELNE